jgi:uncharacterized lipoprotein YddW (UPF0748 family)
MDPAEPIAMQQTLNVISDVVRRYDVDGVHIDDYFYPYPVKAANGSEVEFPDDKAWIRYLQSGGNLMRADWRRANVNHLVEAIYNAVHQEKSWVKFGISRLASAALTVYQRASPASASTTNCTRM